MNNVLTFTDRGIYCSAGDFYIDPCAPVPRALITHGHADHARDGMGSYLATKSAAPVMKHRLGNIKLDTIEYGQTLKIGGAVVSFHPAGHVPGSAQIKVEVGGQIWVASGDYKTVNDGLSEPFSPVKCHTFITETTFGLPIFRWTPQDMLADQLNTWWATNAAQGRFSILSAYALGKAQRLMNTVNTDIGPILTHSAIENTNGILRAQGIALPKTIRVTPDLNIKDYMGALVLATPSAMTGTWSRRFGHAATAFASGWMTVRGVRRRRGVERGFIMSDHADWDGLNNAIAATEAEKIFVTHGYTAQFQRWLTEQGYDAHVVSTNYVNNGEDEA